MPLDGTASHSEPSRDGPEAPAPVSDTPETPDMQNAARLLSLLGEAPGAASDPPAPVAATTVAAMQRLPLSSPFIPVTAEMDMANNGMCPYVVSMSAPGALPPQVMMPAGLNAGGCYHMMQPVIAEKAPGQLPQQMTAQQIPAQQVALQQMPVQQVAVQQMPGQHVPEQQVPAQQVALQPGQQLALQQVPGQQMAVQQMPAQQVPMLTMPAMTGMAQSMAPPAMVPQTMGLSSMVPQQQQMMPAPMPAPISSQQVVTSSVSPMQQAYTMQAPNMPANVVLMPQMAIYSPAGMPAGVVQSNAPPQALGVAPHPMAPPQAIVMSQPMGPPPPLARHGVAQYPTLASCADPHAVAPHAMPTNGPSTVGTNVMSTSALASQGVMGRVGPVRGASRVRQSHRASPARMDKQGWTREEDLLIVQRVQVYGQKWSVIAEALPGRTDDAVRSRYLRLQRKSMLPGSSTRGGDMWTAAEDARIQEAFHTLGPRWQAISELLPGRSPNAMRNRFLRCETNGAGKGKGIGGAGVANNPIGLKGYTNGTNCNGDVNGIDWCGSAGNSAAAAIHPGHGGEGEEEEDKDPREHGHIARGGSVQSVGRLIEQDFVRNLRDEADSSWQRGHHGAALQRLARHVGGMEGAAASGYGSGT